MSGLYKLAVQAFVHGWVEMLPVFFYLLCSHFLCYLCSFAFLGRGGEFADQNNANVSTACAVLLKMPCSLHCTDSLTEISSS